MLPISRRQSRRRRDDRRQCIGLQAVIGPAVARPAAGASSAGAWLRLRPSRAVRPRRVVRWPRSRARNLRAASVGRRPILLFLGGMRPVAVRWLRVSAGLHLQRFQVAPAVVR